MIIFDDLTTWRLSNPYNLNTDILVAGNPWSYISPIDLKQAPWPRVVKLLQALETGCQVFMTAAPFPQLPALRLAEWNLSAAYEYSAKFGRCE